VLAQISFWSYTGRSMPQTRWPSSPLPQLSMRNKYTLIPFHRKDNTTRQLDYPTRQILIAGPTHRHCGPIKRETHKPGTPPPTTYPEKSLSLSLSTPTVQLSPSAPHSFLFASPISNTRAPKPTPRSPGFPPAPSLQAIRTEPDAASPKLASFW
jgi:hypothetical protein